MTPGESRGDGAALSPAEELAARKAWPAATVRQDQVEQAQQDFKAIKGRGHRKAALKWTSIGPLVAFQPGVLGFTGRDQVTAGRTTALLVDRTCNQGRCRVWIGTAGGGVWRTDHGMHTEQPRMEVLLGRARLECVRFAGAGPERQEGRYALRRYGRTQCVCRFRGRTWSVQVHRRRRQLEPDSRDPPPSRRRVRSAKIAIDPIDGRIIYLAMARGVRGISSTSGGAVSTTGRGPAELGVYKTTDGGATWSLVWDAQTAGSLRGVTDSRSIRSITRRSTRPRFSSGSIRSLAGGPFQQVFAGQAAASNVDRTEFALAALPRTAKRASTRPTARRECPIPYAALFRNDDASALVQGSRERGAVEEAHVECERHSALRDVRLLHGPVLVRPGRRDAARDSRTRCS